MTRLKNWIPWLLLIGFVLVYPMLFGIVLTNLFVRFAVFAVFAASLNMLLSFTGLLSFGHAMFFGIGGYATALALDNIPGLGLMTCMAIGALAGTLLALIVSPILVRVKDTAFALLTLALGQILYIACLKFRGLTHGEDGVGGFPIPPFRIPGVLSVDMGHPQSFYYFAVAVCAASLLLMWYATRTPFGSIMAGIRDNPLRVNYLGFNIPFAKTIMFLISGCFAGVAGSVYALFQNLVSPDSVFHTMHSFTAIMMVFVGGIGTFAGPIIGSAVLTTLEELATRYTQQILLINGLLLITVVIFFRSGFIGLFNLIRIKCFSKSEEMLDGHPGDKISIP
jgi:branched-chain amino acid transport system permease protein